MNRLVLIGNGFDLAHGLLTSYKHFFLWYLTEWGGRLLRGQNKVESDGLCSFRIRDSIDLRCWADAFQGWYFRRENPYVPWDKSKAIIKAIQDQNLTEFTFPSPLLERIWKQLLLGWVDIENEYYSLLLEEKVTMNEGFVQPDYKALNKHMDILRDYLIRYLGLQNGVETSVDNDIKEKIYCPVEENEISVIYKGSVDKTILDEKEPASIMLLNFNYTDTPEKYVTDPSKVIVNYIHGKLDKPESIIFGYGDELDEGYQKLRNNKDNECLRHIKSIRYLESANYRKMLEFVESGPFQICIMGHSCGNSDRTLLNTLFEHRNCVSIKPYYYINEKGVDNYIELVQNISRNFTDMKLMRDRVVNKEYCEPLSGKKPGKDKGMVH
jgi:hypothetical protein